MQIIEADYEIVTPMFIGGADKTEAPEIRPPSVKGALRFWWRALQWGACLKQAQGNTDKALQALHEQEAELFGAAFRNDKYGQGKVLLKVKRPQSALKTMTNFKPSAGQQYLLGQGLYHFKNGLLQPALKSQQTFTIILKLDNKVDAQSIIDVVMLFGLLGGLGSRLRKGWGSVAIRSLTYLNKDGNKDHVTVPDDKVSYKKALSELLGELPDDMPPFSAFSKHTRIDLSTSTNKSPDRLLTEVGSEQQMYRSYGKDMGGGHKVAGKEAEKNFKGDHDLILDFAQGKHVTEHPKRAVFGLPHNYFYSNGTKVDVDAEAESGKSSRRASPLMIHIHQFASGEAIAIQSLVKADFLPDRKQIQLKKGHKTQMLECHVDWTVITDYLDRFNQGERIL